MLHVLIADDEKIIRDGIEHIIANYSDKYNFFHAENGMDALQIICSNNIDIVFADIKMPVLNGIELLEKLRSIHYMGPIVIISGYEDYEYVHGAMKLGVVDYILKPIIPEELIALLNICHKEICKHKQRSLFYTSRKIKQDIKLLYNQQGILENLLNGSFTLYDFLKDKHIEDYHYHTIIVINIVNKKIMEESERILIFQKYCTLFNKSFTNDELIFIQGILDKVWTILFFHKESNNRFRIESILNKENIQYGLEESCHKADFKKIFEIANIKLNKNFYDYNTININGDYKELMKSSPYTETIKRLTNALSSLNMNDFKKYLKIFLYEVCTEKVSKDTIKNLLIKMIYQVLSDNNEFISVVSKYKFTDLDVTHLIQDASSATQLYQSLISTINHYIDEVKEKTEHTEDYIIKRMKNYVSSNYNGDVQLNEIAQLLQMHPNYLSSYFKEKTDKTFSQYVRSYRIKKAKELLQENNLKLFEIATQVGYKDNANFYRAFKKETGFSPKDFKNSN